MDKTDNPLLSGAASFLGVAPDAKPTDVLISPTFKPASDAFDEDETVRRRARGIAAAKNLFSTDVSKLDDAQLSGLYQATAKALFDIEDTDGKVAFGKKAGKPRQNIELLRQFCRGDYKVIQDDEYQSWAQMDEEQKFRYALEKEGTRNKVKSYIGGERAAGLLENLAAGAQYSGIGLPPGAMSVARQTTGNDKLEQDAQTVLMESARRSNYETLTPEEKAAYRADVIDDYDKKLSKRQALATYLAMKDGLSDRASMLLAKAFNTGSVDVDEMEALKPLDRDRAYTALSIMRGDQKKGRLFTTLWMNEQDFTDETNWNRFQLGLYGLQQSIFALATDTWDIGKGAVKWTYAKMLLDEAQRKRYFDRWDAETRAEQALKQGLPEAEGAFGEGFQSLMENIHWFIPYGMIGKGGKLMRASAGVAEDAKWYKKLAVTFTPWKFGSNEKLVEEIQKAGLEIAKARHAHSLDTLDRIHRAMGTTEFAAENTVLARQAANVELYTKALQEAQKAVKAAKASGYAGLSMYAAGEASAFSAFANEYIANCDAAGVSRENSVPMAAAIGWINAKIEKIYVPGLESGLSRSEVKSLMFSSLLNAIRTDGMTGARQWLGNRVRYGISEGIKVALEEGVIEEPLQQIVSEHGKSIAATSQKLRENGQGDLADQLTAYWDSIKDTAAHDFKTYIDTAIDMIPSSVGFGLTTVGNQTRRQHIENVWRRHANRVKYENAVEEAKKNGLPIPTAPTMFSPGPGGTIQLNPDGLDVDLGVADIVGKATQVRKMIREHWDGTDASAESGALAADPNGVAKAIAAARKAWDAGEGDVVRKIADAAAVDYKTAEALSDYFTKEAQAALGSPNVKNFIAHDLSTVNFSEETMAKVLPGYVRGSFVHDEEKGVYSGKVTLPNGETKTIAYVYGDISNKLSALVDEQSKVDSNLGKSHDARVKSGTESGKLWSEMDEADRRAYAIRQVNALSTGSGCFTVTDKKGEEIIINADDVIYLSNGELGNVGYGAMATMGTVRHETWHSIWRFVSSELSSDDKQKLAKTLGVDVTAEGWEADLDEAMAYQFEQYASGNYVNHAVDGLVSGFVDSATGKMVRQLSKIGFADEIKNPKTGKAYALADFYDAVLRGQIGTGRLGYAQTEAPAAEAPKAEKKRSTTSEIPIEVKAEEVDAAEEEAAKASEKTEPEAPPPPAAPKVEHTLDNPADASVPDARFYRISAGDGVTLVGELVVSDASQLKTSYKGNLSDPKLQNRGETKEGASLVEKIAGRPDALQVGTIQPRANNGFVWTTPSLDVFIGNTRSTGVTYAYERGNGAGVDAHMRAEAQKRGIEIPEGVKSPVVHFVLRKIESEGGKADIYDVVRMTNESVNRGMNKYEQAKNDADVLVNNNIVPGIVLNAEGDVDTAKSSDAIGAFRQLTGAQGLVDENTDLLSEEGQERIKNAVLASLLKDADPSLMAKLVSQSEHLDIENEKSALMRMSSELMRLAAAKPQYDLQAPIVEALEYYTEWRDRDEKLRAEAGKDRRSWTEKTTDGKRKRGLTWEHHMGQGDMFRTPSQEARMIGDLLAAARELRSFDKEDNESSAGKKRAQDLIGSYLADYMANAHAVNTETEDMFGTPPPTRAELMTQHRTKDGAARFSTTESNNGDFSRTNNDIRFSAVKTDTPEFQAWFADSKIVDTDGKPLRVYRGAEFNPAKQPEGKGVVKPMSYFSADPNYARRYGEIGAYYLKIEHPFDIRDPECEADFKKIYPNVNLARGDSGALDWAEASTVDDEFLEENFPGKYDGIIFDEQKDWTTEGNTAKWRGLSYVPLFGGSQVKSATDNIGTFDPTNPDVRFSTGSFRHGIYDPRATITKVRGGWTENKIKKEVKTGSLRGEDAALRLIAEFDDLAEFKEHLYWHGSGNGISGTRLVPSIVKSQAWIERNGGGGYGQGYWGISVSKSKKRASNFGDQQSRGTTVYPIILAKGANVIDGTKYQDAADVADDIVELWNNGVDAIRIGDWSAEFSEQELLVLNPSAICNIGNGEWYAWFDLGTERNPINMRTDAYLQDALDYAKSYDGIPRFNRPKKPSMFNETENGLELKDRAKREEEEAKYKSDLENWERSPDYQLYLGAKRKRTEMLRFSVVGVTGAKNLGIGNPQEATTMEESGATREEIWRKTGWWRGRDGRWRVEIDPPYLADRSKFEFLKGGELVRLGELFPDSPVIRAYGLERIPVITDFVGEREVLKGATAGFGYSINGEEGIVVTPNLVRGVYTKPNTSQLRMLEKISPEYAAFSREWARMFDAYDSIGDEEAEKWENRIRAELAATEVGKVFEDIRSDKGTRFIPSEHFLSVITHEIQHIIQEREGHAQGGNPGLFMKGFSTEEIDARIAGLNAELDKVIAAGEDKDAFDRLRQEIRDAEDEKWKAEKEARDNAVIRYRHLAGEVEARNVEKRLNMTIEKRTSTPPWETEDVNWQDQTLRFSPNEPTQQIIDGLKEAWQFRFSTAPDSVAEKLEEQRKKIEENGGKLLLAHHGTDTRGFTRFEKSDDIGFFFSKNRSTAASYIRNGNHGSEEKPGLPSYDEILTYLKDEASGPYLEKKWWIVDEFGQIPMFPVDGQDSFDNERDAKRMFDLMPSVMKGRGLKEGYAIGRRIYGENEQMPYDELKEIYLRESGENSGIYDVALKMTDPYEIDCRGSNWDSIYDVTDDPETRNYVFVAVEYDATMDEMELRYREYGEDDVQIEAFKNLNDFLRAIRDRFGDNFGEDEKSAIEKAVSAGEDFSEVIVDGRPEKGALGAIYSYNSLSEEGYYVNPQSTHDIVSSAKEMGCDGVIFRNVLDNGGGIREADIDDVYVVMNPAQVKLTDEITYADDGSIVPYEKRVDWGNDDMRFSIVGENGAKRSSVGSASEAAAMEKTGATGEDIWRNTGWWRGHDGKWRIEIPGYSAGNEIADYHRASGKSAFAVSDVLSDTASQNRHEGLAILTKAYPKLKKLTIKFVKDPPTGIDAKAAYVPDENAVEIYHRASEDPRGEGFSITHELQHAIQWQEGFSYGDTSATTAGEGTSKANKKRYFSNQGEFEAYLSQARSLMGDRQRSSIPPWETERLLLDSIGRQFGFRIKPREIRFSISTPWEAGFPDATAQTTRKYINDHHAELFRLAKGGNVDAAEELVEKVCKPDKIRQLGKNHPNATIVAPVIAQEASGHNQIPRVFARYVASLLGIDTDRNIVQSVRANHTGSNASHRLFVNPEFDGQVVKGAEYIIVDDHIAQGGTVNALRDHIESNGGKVVAVAALTLSQGSGKLSPNKDTLDELKRKWPDIDNLLRIAGIADSAGGLTQSQARYILKFSPDTFRNRAVAQGNDRGGRTRSETLGAPSTEKVKTSGRDSSKPAFSTVKPQTVASAYPRLDKLSDEQLIAAAVASKMVFGKRGKLKNKYANVNEVQRYIKALHPGLDNLEVSRKTQEVLRAVREIGGRMKDDLARGVSESQILKNLPDRMKDVFTGEMTAEAIKGANIGSYQARARMKIDEKAAKVIEDAVAVQSGVETSLLENAYGIDFSQTIMSLEENPFLKKDGNGNFLPLPGSGFEQAEGQGQTTAKEEREVSQAIKKAVDEIAKRSKEQLETEDRNAETRRHESDDLSDHGENGGDIGDLTESDIAAIATKRAGVDLRNPRQLALFIAELARRWWVKKNGLAQDAEAFRDRVALQFLRKTAANIYTKLVREITYSQSRDSATQAINGFDNAPTLRGLLSEMTYVGQLVNARKIRETQQGMCEKLDQLLREKFGAVGRFKADREELRRKVSAEMELRARYARHAIWLTPNAVGEEAQRLRDELNMVATNFETADHDANHSRVMEENLRKLNILREFGGLRYKPLADIEAALNYWDNALEGETDAIVRANYERDVRTKAAAALFAKAFHNPKRKYAREGGLVSSIGDYIQGHMSFTHLLRDMMRYAESEDSEKAEKIIQYLELEIQKAGTRSTTEQRKHANALAAAVKQLYGRDFTKVLSEFAKEDERFAPFMGEKDGTKIRPTKGRAIQLMVSLLQVGHQVEVQDPNDPKKTVMQWVGGYHDNIVKHHREGQAERIAALLTPADLNLVKWIGQWYEANRQELSEECQALFGMGVYAETWNYFPVKMLLDKQGLEKGESVGWTIFPKALTPRVRNERDFDTEADVLQMFMSRMEEAAQWKAHAKLGLEMRGIFGRTELQNAVIASHGKKANDLMLGFITDILSGHGAYDRSPSGVEYYSDMIRGWAALGALGGNVGVMFKQTTSIPAFGFEIGMIKTAKHMASAFTPEGIEAMRKIFDSDERKNRWQTGNTEAVKNALASNKAGLLKKMLQASMITNKLGDCVPGLVIGQGVYRDALDRGMSDEDAMAYTWMLIERTQQSGRIENQTSFQRRAKLGRILYQFLSTQQQYLQYETRAIRKVIANPSLVNEEGRKRWMELGRAAVLNHFILSSAYFWMGQLYKRWLGQEPPEDELKDWTISCLLGPYGALFCAGFTCTDALNEWIKGPRYGGGSSVPSLSWAGNILVRDPAKLISTVFDDGKTFDDVLNEAAKFASDFNAIFRDLRKIYRWRIRKESQ